MKLKIHIIIYLTLRYVTEFFTDGMHFRKKLLKERLPFYLFTCLCLYLIISHIDYLFYVEAYELATKSNWRVVPSLEGFNIFLRTWPSVRSAGMFYAFVIIIIYNIYFWISILIPSLYKFVKKNIMMISLMLIFYPVLEYQLFWSYYFAYLFLKSCWAAWPLYIIWLYNFHLLHFAEELEEELEQNTTENEFDNIKFEESVVGDDDDDNSKVSSTYDDEIFGERPEALMIRYDEHIRKWYPDLLKEVKEVIIPVDEEQYVTYNAEGEPQFKYLVDEQLYNIRLLLAEQPKDIRQFYVIKMRWLWALPWEHYIRYKKYKRKFFRILVYFPMIIKAFTFSGFKKPKVVGPYSIFVPKWTVETWCKDRLTYNNYFIWILLKIFHYIYNFFSIFRRIDNFKWSLFQMKYLSQLKKLKKKKVKIMLILNLERSNNKKLLLYLSVGLLITLIIYDFHSFFTLYLSLSNYLHSVDLLLLIIILLVFFILTIIFIPHYNSKLIKQLGLGFSCFIFILSLILWIFYNNEVGNFVYVSHISWLDSFNIYYSLGIDGISIFFIILTAFLMPICLLMSWNSIVYKIKEFVLMLLITELLLINVFAVLDLFFFYIFFESVLIPMFVIIGVWGSRQRKIHAAYQFFFYTLFGSILMLLGIVIIYLQSGTTDIQLLTQLEFSKSRQLILWLAFFASFATKVPMIPVHIWLPEAHVEAPTAGSVILAGVLLKLGVYGIIRFMIPMFPYAMYYFTPLVFTMCIISIIYSASTTIRQIDLKKIIAYSSVAHMNFALLGLFTNNSQGIEGCLFFMLGHGVVSSALFLCIGMLYDRYHTRNLLYYGGLVQVMPIFSIFFLVFTLANLGLPGMVNFVGEFLVLVGTWKVNTTVIVLASIGLILGAVYSIWFYNRLVFGQIRFYSLQKFSDLNRREFFVLLPLFIMVFVMGIFPALFLNVFNISVNNYIYL